MKSNVFIILFFVILLIGSSIYFFILKPSREKFIQENDHKIETELPAALNSKTIDYSETGNLVNTDPLSSAQGPDFSLLYERPGKPALKTDLIFDKDSRCNLGQGFQTCDSSILQVGLRVKITGVKTNEKVIVVGLEKAS